MKKFLCFILFVSLCFSAYGASKKWLNYVNSRFGYEIKYPNIFSQQTEPANGDGIFLESKGGKIKLTLSGGFNVLMQDGQSILEGREIKNVIKKESGQNYFRIVCQDGKNIIHEYGIVNDDNWASFTFSYPDTKNFDKEIQRMEQTLKLSN